MDNRVEQRRHTRRGFLRSAVAGAATVAAGTAVRANARSSDPARERLEQLAAEYGSELGELRRTGGES